jgi:hypothetical protein
VTKEIINTAFLEHDWIVDEVLASLKPLWGKLKNTVTATYTQQLTSKRRMGALDMRILAWSYLRGTLALLKMLGVSNESILEEHYKVISTIESRGVFYAVKHH